MSTNSTISIKNPDGTIIMVYCHWDGYPEHNGRILVENYTTEVLVNDLLSYGDISILGETVGHKHDFNFPGKGQCTFYRRDRNEGDVSPITVANISEAKQQFQEYNYIFMENEWYEATGNELLLVKDLLKEEQE